VSYHSSLKQKRQTTSWLDDVEGIGPATKRRLIRHFGSSSAVKKATTAELVEVLGKKRAEQLIRNMSMVEESKDKGMI
jgi:excinuclease ABC subunit C